MSLNLDKNRLGFDILIQLSVATLFFFAYSMLLPFVLPRGITSLFFENVVKHYWPVLWSAALFILTCLFLRKLELRRERSGWLKRSDFVLVLLPMGSIIQYLILNIDILDAPNTLLILLFSLGFTLLFCYLIPMVYPNNDTREMLMLLGISVVFIIFNMPSLAGRFSWHRSGEFYIQFMVFLSVFFLLFLLHRHARKLLTIMVLAFVLSGLAFPIIKSHSDKQVQSRELDDLDSIFQLADKKAMLRTPDIFLLTYDAYISNETMLQYGIDNSSQELFLIERGFHVYKGIYSQGADTLATMDRMLDLAFQVNPSRKGVSGAGVVQKILSSRGYYTYGVINTDYLFMGIKPSYDEYYPREAKKSAGLITKAVFEGEFRFDIGFEAFDRSTFLERKRAIFVKDRTTPLFLYTHTGPGHSQNSGKCLPNEVDLFAERLLESNGEMKKDIDAIIQNNPDALIIVNGDHGPYLTKNCTSLRNYDKDEVDRLDIQDRFGAFLAIRWPEDAEVDHSDIMILQDVFPVVFSYLFNDEAFLDYRMPRKTMDSVIIGGVYVEDGIIHGGPDDGELLFLDQ